MNTQIHRLGPDDLDLMDRLSALFGEVFNEIDTYTAHKPGETYLRDLLSRDGFIALVALAGDELVGGLVAYEMRKFEQVRSEFYIYDLGVAEAHRRQGIATALIRETCRIAKRMGGWVVMIQADYQDAPAVALYTKLGTREEVLHFDLAVDDFE